MKLIRPSCNTCKALVKAIDAYIAKADNDLENEMDNAGYVEAKNSIKGASDLEEEVTDILTEQTAEIAEIVENAGTIPKAKKAVKEYFENDMTGTILSDTFSDYFQETILSLSDSYMKETEGDLAVTQLRQRTSSWIEEWSDQLSDLMQLTSENKMGELLEEALVNGKGTNVLAQQLINEGIRQEGFRARAASLTEMLRAHSVAQQESIMQSPATDRKKWLHSGGHKIKPRENHQAMNGQIVPKADPFELTGRDGGTYYPMYPRDPILPAAESINCHCIHIPVTNDDILGLSYEERQKMQQEIIAADDGEWEKELDEANRLRSGITNMSTLDVSNNTSLMKPRLRAGKVEEKVSFKEGGKVITVQSYKINGSQFEMYADTSKPSKKLLRIVENNMAKIVKDLPDDMDIPKILICDFENIPISSTAIGGYNKESSLLLFNSKYNTKTAIKEFLTETPDWFANTDLSSPYRHEMGHAYHDYLVKRIATMKGVEYNEAKRLFDSRVRRVIKEMSYQDGNVVKTQLSGYSSFEYGNRTSVNNIDEVMSEWYTVKDEEETKPFVDEISNIVKEVMSDDGLQ